MGTHEIDNFANSEIGRKRAVLWGHTNALAGRELVRGFAHQAYRATVKAAQPQQDLDGSGLTGAVGTKQRDDLAAANFERDAAQGRGGPQLFFDVC